MSRNHHIPVKTYTDKDYYSDTDVTINKKPRVFERRQVLLREKRPKKILRTESNPSVIKFFNPQRCSYDSSSSDGETSDESCVFLNEIGDNENEFVKQGPNENMNILGSKIPESGRTRSESESSSDFAILNSIPEQKENFEFVYHEKNDEKFLPCRATRIPSRREKSPSESSCDYVLLNSEPEEKGPFVVVKHEQDGAKHLSRRESKLAGSSRKTFQSESSPLSLSNKDGFEVVNPEGNHYEIFYLQKFPVNTSESSDEFINSESEENEDYVVYDKPSKTRSLPRRISSSRIPVSKSGGAQHSENMDDYVLLNSETKKKGYVNVIHDNNGADSLPRRSSVIPVSGNRRSRNGLVFLNTEPEEEENFELVNHKDAKSSKRSTPLSVPRKGRSRPEKDFVLLNSESEEKDYFDFVEHENCAKYRPRHDRKISASRRERYQSTSSEDSNLMDSEPVEDWDIVFDNARSKGKLRQRRENKPRASWRERDIGESSDEDAFQNTTRSKFDDGFEVINFEKSRNKNNRLKGACTVKPFRRVQKRKRNAAPLRRDPYREEKYGGYSMKETSSSDTDDSKKSCVFLNNPDEGDLYQIIGCGSVSSGNLPRGSTWEFVMDIPKHNSSRSDVISQRETDGICSSRCENESLEENAYSSDEDFVEKNFKNFTLSDSSISNKK